MGDLKSPNLSVPPFLWCAVRCRRGRWRTGERRVEEERALDAATTEETTVAEDRRMAVIGIAPAAAIATDATSNYRSMCVGGRRVKGAGVGVRLNLQKKPGNASVAVGLNVNVMGGSQCISLEIVHKCTRLNIPL